MAERDASAKHERPGAGTTVVGYLDLLAQFDTTSTPAIWCCARACVPTSPPLLVLTDRQRRRAPLRRQPALTITHPSPCPRSSVPCRAATRPCPAVVAARSDQNRAVQSPCGAGRFSACRWL